MVQVVEFLCNGPQSVLKRAAATINDCLAASAKSGARKGAAAQVVSLYLLHSVLWIIFWFCFPFNGMLAIR